MRPWVPDTTVHFIDDEGLATRLAGLASPKLTAFNCR